MAESTCETVETKAIEVKCRILGSELSFLNRSIRNHPDNDKSYYLKATKLKELGKLTGNMRKYEEALASFNKAIALDSENLQYLIKRADLLVIIYENQKAFSNLQVAASFVKDILARPHEDLSMQEIVTINAILNVAQMKDEPEAAD